MAKVGLGVIIVNKEGKILIGKRKGSHAPVYSIPGGHLEDGETFEDGARREINEETGLILKDVKVIGITNNLETYKKEGIHNISVHVLCKDFEGEPKVIELNKCEGWQWADPKHLPEPHFDASKMAVENYIKKRFYYEYF